MWFVISNQFCFFFLFFNVILWFIDKISFSYRGYQAANYIPLENFLEKSFDKF